MDTKEIARLSRSIRYSILKMGKSGDADDAVQDVLAEMLRCPNSGRSVDQHVVDYIRKQYGRKGLRGHSRRIALKNASIYDDGTHSKADDDSYRADLFHGIDIAEISAMLKPKDRMMFLLIFKWGFNGREIAHLFGFTEPWASAQFKDLVKLVKSLI